MSDVVFLDVARVFSDQRALVRASAEIEDCVVWVAHRDGGLTLINPTIERWTGMPTYSAVGTGWLRTVHPSHRDYCYGTLLTALRESKPWSLNFSLLGADDREFWVIAGARCVVDPRGNRLIGAFGACVRMDSPDPFGRLQAVLGRFPGRAAALSAQRRGTASPAQSSA
jgi:PAS domain-containing protein